MPLNKQAFLEQYRLFPPKLRLLTEKVLQNHKYLCLRKRHLKRNTFFHYAPCVTKPLLEHYDNPSLLEALCFTQPVQEDQKIVLQVLESAGVVKVKKDYWYLGAFKFSNLDIFPDALLEVETCLSEDYINQPPTALNDTFDSVSELYLDPLRQELCEIQNGKQKLIHNIRDPKYLRFWQYLFKHTYQPLPHEQIRQELNIRNFSLSDYLKNSKISKEMKTRYFPDQQSNRILLFQNKISQS